MKGRQGKVAFSSNVVNNRVREWNLGQGPPACELLKELCHEILGRFKRRGNCDQIE